MSDDNVEIVEEKVISVGSVEPEKEEMLPVAKPLDGAFDLFAQLNTAASQPDIYKEEHIHKLTKELINNLSTATKYKDPELSSWETKFAELETKSAELLNTKTQEYETKIKELENKLSNVNQGRMGKIYKEDSVANEKTNGNLDTWLSLPKAEQTKFFAANKNVIKANIN